MATRIIAIANQKGGVGKTTTAVTLAHGLTLLGQPALIVDLDPQGHCALALGIEQSPDAARFLGSFGDDPKRFIKATGRRGLGLIAGDKKTVGATQGLEGNGEHPAYLRETLLAPIMRNNGEPTPRFIVLDTPPGLGWLQRAAIWASDFVIIPSGCDFLSTNGAGQIYESLQVLRSDDGKPWRGELYGVLPTMHDATRESAAVLAELRENFGPRVLSPISRAVAVKEATACGKTIFEYAPQSKPWSEYSVLVHNIMERAQ